MEESGLSADVRRTEHETKDWAVYWAEVGPEAEVVLRDAEHDRFAWVSLAEALRRCRPERVAKQIELVAAHLTLELGDGAT